MSTTWTWKQIEGELFKESGFVGKGFAGAPGHINKQESESLKDLGPIPRGTYDVSLIYPSHPKFGPTTIVLKPRPGNKMFNRSGFLIHGDSIKKPGTGSTGCIILGPAIRRMFRVGDVVIVK